MSWTPAVPAHEPQTELPPLALTHCPFVPGTNIPTGKVPVPEAVPVTKGDANDGVLSEGATARTTDPDPVTPLDKSEALGCACAGTPLVEMLVRKLCVTALMDSTPPSALALGLGSRAEGSVPEEILAALVASVEHEGAALDRSAHDGCACVKLPVP